MPVDANAHFLPVRIALMTGAAGFGWGGIGLNAPNFYRDNAPPRGSVAFNPLNPVDAAWMAPLAPGVGGHAPAVITANPAFVPPLAGAAYVPPAGREFGHAVGNCAGTKLIDAIQQAGRTVHCLAEMWFATGGVAAPTTDVHTSAGAAAAYANGQYVPSCLTCQAVLQPLV